MSQDLEMAILKTREASRTLKKQVETSVNELSLFVNLLHLRLIS